MTSAFGVPHTVLAKAVTDTDDPAMKAPVTTAPGKVDPKAIQDQLRSAKLGALKAVRKV